MKVLITRKKHPCGYRLCPQGKEIGRGVIATRIIQWWTGNGTNQRRTTYFHNECYKLSMFTLQDEKTRELEGVLERRRARNKGGKIGRPAKYRDMLKAQRLMSLRNYHKGQGNEARVEELEQELCALEIGSHQDSGDIPEH